MKAHRLPFAALILGGLLGLPTPAPLDAPDFSTRRALLWPHR